MLYELFEFGGIIFFIIIGIILWITFSYIESVDEGDIPIGLIPIIGTILFFLFTKVPEISIRWILAYLITGLIIFFLMFYYNLLKIRAFVSKNKRSGITLEDILSKDRNIEKLYRYEPSFTRFIDRVFCWPICIIKIFFKDMIYDIYTILHKHLTRYKNTFINGS